MKEEDLEDYKPEEKPLFNEKFRLIRIPKPDYENDKVVEANPETKELLEEIFEVFSKDGKVWPKSIRKDLHTIGKKLVKVN